MALRSCQYEEWKMGSVKLIDSAEQFRASSASLAEALPKGHERFEMAAVLIERMADLTAVVAATTLAYAVYEFLQIGRQLHYSASTVLIAAVAFSAVFVVMLDHEGAYKRAN